MKTATSVILKKPGSLIVREIEVPKIPLDSIEVEMKACGICGSDIRYLAGENPWSQHTLGKNLPSPPNMVLGHEVAGITRGSGTARRIAVLAFRGCGICRLCINGDENLCEDMYHFGHSAGWSKMDYYPGGMADSFNIWNEGAVTIPESISFEAAVFLDGLAVALHALETGDFEAGKSVGIIGMGPVGMLAAKAAGAMGASFIAGCDTDSTPIRLALEGGIEHAINGGSEELLRTLKGSNRQGVDLIIDTVGTYESIEYGLKALDKRGAVVLLAVHGESLPFKPLLLNGERKVITSANNRYKDFTSATQLLADRRIEVEHLITHRFNLQDAAEAFRVMQNKEEEQAFKVILSPCVLSPAFNPGNGIRLNGR
ncbi:MAG: alcohol dehydrogenase catalytic domain-containing protein [Spirochaetales bacterium]|jgi:2-desacetyl-2-hydroxyethyl bacteriochlorophyllide A dehydrogenase|nr:alcohol dehydrogenase catalytic domain-containing protein [Spirochaetales bacterium]